MAREQARKSTAHVGRTREEEAGGANPLRRVSALALGILAGIGGFVDFGGVVTSTQAGAQYRYGLIWTIVVGLIGFAVFAEMAGRVTISTGRTMYDVIRDRLGARLALLPLVSTTISQILTVFVELAGMALVAGWLLKVSYLLWIPLCAVLVWAIIWWAGFELLDNTAALLGLTMMVAVAVMISTTKDWGSLAAATVHPTFSGVRSPAAYLFFVISLFGAYMTPYQFAFYSSGVMEQEWNASDFLTNRVVAIVGTAFGAVVTLALMAGAAGILFPRHATVSTFAATVVPASVTLGAVGIGLFLCGTFAVSLGAGLEASMSGSYAIMQYYGWDWGKKGRPGKAPLFHFVVILFLVVGILIGETGVNPIAMTTFAMAVGAVTLPFSFIPLMIVANDRDFMGEQRNSLGTNLAAWLILALLTVVTLTAIPLLILSGSL